MGWFGRSAESCIRVVGAGAAFWELGVGAHWGSCLTKGFFGVVGLLGCLLGGISSCLGFDVSIHVLGGAVWAVNAVLLELSSSSPQA